MVCRAGKKTTETALLAELRLETTDMVRCTRLVCQSQGKSLRTTLEEKLFDSERQHFICFFIDDRSATLHRPVSIQLQPVTENSPNNHRSFSDVTSCKTYRRPVGDHTFNPNMGIRWLHWSQRSPVNRNEISREEVVSRSQCLCNRSLHHHFITNNHIDEGFIISIIIKMVRGGFLTHKYTRSMHRINFENL